MARYITTRNNLFQDSFISINEAQTYAMANFGAVFKNGLLFDKNGDSKPLKEIFEDNDLELSQLKNFIDPYGIVANEIANVHIEDGRLVITLKDGAQKKIKY